MNLNERLFAADRSVSAAQEEVEELLETHSVEYSNIGWDWYDNSLEIYGVPTDSRLSGTALEALLTAGFAVIYVNHVDKWETHYSQRNRDGWRVSYPHKRNDGDARIWVEKRPPSWPKEWDVFETNDRTHEVRR